MLKKNNEVKWNIEAKESFQTIKEALGESPVLVIPNYDKYFSMFSFTSEHTIVVVSLQKNDESRVQPIAYFSRALIYVELTYNKLEKQAYALVKSLKAFIDYILHSKTFSYVRNISIKCILMKPNCNDPHIYPKKIKILYIISW
jgi:hypothetical protein